MTTDNLYEFLHGRVLPTRQLHHMQYPVSMDEPGVGVMIDCPEDATTIVVLPTIVQGAMHLEMHFFADGVRTDPICIIPDETNGCVELTLRKPAML
jgi:hypothetical protein